MTPQEQQMIDGLIQRVQNAPVAEKDFDAEQHIQQALGRNPNALYILVQTVLVQSYALEQAQKQLADAKQSLAQAQQQQQPKHATSFLGSIFGSGDDKPAPPPPQAQYAPVPSYGQPQYGQPQQYPPSYAQQYQPQQQAPAGGGFLRGAMQTAAGVAAGALAFEGVESLMHGFGGHSGGFGGGSGFGSFGGGDAPREEIVNNYYGDASPSEHEHTGHGFADTNSDIEDRTGDSGDDDTSSFDTASSSGDDDSAFDDSSSDDSSSDDSSSDDSSFS